MSGCRNEAGRLFQILGPEAEKLLSPNLVCVRGTVRRLPAAERSWRHPESAISCETIHAVKRQRLELSTPILAEI